MLRLAKLSLVGLILLLPVMKPQLAIGGLGAVAADFAFLATMLLWGLALMAGETRLRWHPAYWGLAAYFAAMALSLSVSPDPGRGAFKLASQAYLLMLTVMAYHLVDGWADLRRCLASWLAVSALLAAAAMATLTLFPLLGGDSILAPMLHDYGTLAPGPYPRLELSFAHPAMLANYLTVSLMILLAAARIGWVAPRPAWILGSGLMAAALFALTPGFGGLLAALGAWGWLSWRERRRGLARWSLAAGLGAAAAAVAVAAVTPIPHSTAPFAIDLGGMTLYPSVRLMAWIDSVRRLIEAPLLGHGLGLGAVGLAYRNPSGELAFVTDAHNGPLNIAVQCGLVGLAGWLAAIAAPLRSAAGASLRHGEARIVQSGLGIALASGFLVQGLVGSFEDARHLWLALGLMLAAGRTDLARR